VAGARDSWSAHIDLAAGGGHGSTGCAGIVAVGKEQVVRGLDQALQRQRWGQALDQLERDQAVGDRPQLLEAAGASLDDLVKMTAYVVDWDPSMDDELVRGGSAARAKRPYPDVALTLIGVASLFTPEMLVEIDAVAALDS